MRKNILQNVLDFSLYQSIYSKEQLFQDSLFSSNELLSMRVLPSLRNTYKGAL